MGSCDGKQGWAFERDPSLFRISDETPPPTRTEQLTVYSRLALVSWKCLTGNQYWFKPRSALRIQGLAGRTSLVGSVHELNCTMFVSLGYDRCRARKCDERKRHGRRTHVRAVGLASFSAMDCTLRVSAIQFSLFWCVGLSRRCINKRGDDGGCDGSQSGALTSASHHITPTRKYPVRLDSSHTHYTTTRFGERHKASRE